MSPEELFAEWGAAWVTRDPAERLRRMTGCCTEDVEFLPPDERPAVRGLATLADHVTEYTSKWPVAVTFGLVGPPQTHHGWSRATVRWTFPSGPADGCDIIRIENGKIATMLVFLETGTRS
jgi:hypothetical protein